MEIDNLDHDDLQKLIEIQLEEIKKLLLLTQEDWNKHYQVLVFIEDKTVSDPFTLKMNLIAEKWKIIQKFKELKDALPPEKPSGIKGKNGNNKTQNKNASKSTLAIPNNSYKYIFF